nr:MAG TPA: hypothetical protein [Caudoviricetes sp.]
MISITEMRDRVHAAMRRAERAGKTGPAKELHKAFISAFPAAPGTLNVNTKTDTLTKKDGTPEVITYVTLMLNTSTEGAYYIAELISQLSEENG